MKLPNQTCILFSFALLAASSVQSAVVVGLTAATEERGITKFSYAIQEEIAEFDGGALKAGSTVLENSISGAVGTFSVEWLAAGEIERPDPFSWRFGSENAALHLLKVGWGVHSAGDENGDLQLGQGEAILLKFDLSNLTVDSGKRLVFSISSAANESYRIYRRTGVESGEISAIVNSDQSGNSIYVPVSGMMEYAITDAGHDKGQALRLIRFAVDVISADEIAVPALSDVSSVERNNLAFSKELSADSPVVEASQDTLGFIL